MSIQKLRERLAHSKKILQGPEISIATRAEVWGALKEIAELELALKDARGGSKAYSDELNRVIGENKSQRQALGRVLKGLKGSRQAAGDTGECLCGQCLLCAVQAALSPEDPAAAAAGKQ